QALQFDAATLPLLRAVQAELSSLGLGGLAAEQRVADADLRGLVELLRSDRRVTGGEPLLGALRLIAPEGPGRTRGPEGAVDERMVQAYSLAALFAGRLIAQLRVGREVPPAWA